MKNFLYPSCTTQRSINSLQCEASSPDVVPPTEIPAFVTGDIKLVGVYPSDVTNGPIAPMSTRVVIVKGDVRGSMVRSPPPFPKEASVGRSVDDAQGGVRGGKVLATTRKWWNVPGNRSSPAAYPPSTAPSRIMENLDFSLDKLCVGFKLQCRGILSLQWLNPLIWIKNYDKIWNSGQIRRKIII